MKDVIVQQELAVNLPLVVSPPVWLPPTACYPELGETEGLSGSTMAVWSELRS